MTTAIASTKPAAWPTTSTTRLSGRSTRRASATGAVYEAEAGAYVTQPTRTVEQIMFPDLGAAEGFYGFECEARGASRVLALESFGWEKATA